MTAPSTWRSDKHKATRPSSPPRGKWSVRNPDFNDILSAFSAEGVRFLSMGGHAVMQYTEPRFTKDLDLGVKPDPTNAERVCRTLCASTSMKPRRPVLRPRIDALALERALARRV